MGLSVVVPARNAEKTLRKCLEAVRASTYQDYELIVVDDGSSDRTLDVAREYADIVIPFSGNSGRADARKRGWGEAREDTLVNIDADVVVSPDTLSIIAGHLNRHPDTDAVTGLLSMDCPYSNFASQYKNLYMHYIFSRLAESVSFLYGSIFAVRKAVIAGFRSEVRIADDTALGQYLVRAGKKIGFLKDCQVVHVKKFTLCSLMRNDFTIPFDWAVLFMRHQGWRDLFKNKTGYAHSPKEQLISVMVAPAVLLLALFGLFVDAPLASVIIPLLIAWLVLNLRFLVFLTKERGVWFGLRSLVFTFFDNIVMACGIICGLLRCGSRGREHTASGSQ